MRRLRGSAPSGISVRCLCLVYLRRLRRSASAAYLIVLFIFRGADIFCAGCSDPRPLVLVGIQGKRPRAITGASGSSFICAGYKDPRPACMSYDSIDIGSVYFVRRLRGFVSGVMLVSPRAPQLAPGVVVVVLFYAQVAAICVRKHLIVTPACEPL